MVCIKLTFQNVPYILELRAQVGSFLTLFSAVLPQSPFMNPLFDPLFGFSWLLNENSNRDCSQDTLAVST